MPKKTVKVVAGPVVVLTYPLTIEASPGFPHDRTLEHVTIDVIEDMIERERAINPREDQSVKQNARRLAILIDMKGYIEPFPANVNEGLGFSLEELGYSQGFCRATALVELHIANPARFAQQFPEGVPVYAYDTDDALAHAALVHDQKQQGLMSKIEIRRTHWAMLNEGIDRRNVNIATWLLMEPGAKGKTAIKKSNDLYAEAEAATNWRVRESKTAEAVEARVKAFQGQIQMAATELRTPGAVACKEFYETGDRPTEGFLSDVDLLPDGFKLKDSDVRDLDKLCKKDETCTVDNPSESYLKAWVKLVQEFLNKQDLPKAAKSLSAKKLVAASRGKSEGIRQVLLFAAQATVTGTDEEGNAVSQEINKGDLATAVEGMRTANNRLSMIEFALNDEDLREAVEDLFEQVQGKRAKVLEAIKANVKANS